MKSEYKALRAGLMVIVLAALLRLAGSEVLKPVTGILRSREMFSLLYGLQTGRVISFETTQPQPPQPTFATEIPPPVTQPAPALTFTAADAELVAVGGDCGYAFDLASLLQQPLELNLTGDEPTVLILHTHATESYAPSPELYTESSPYRTLDPNYNMVSIGAHVARLLEQSGIHVIHAAALHDYPSYAGAYSSARATITDYLARYPSIRLVLDLHRDALSLDNPFQLRTQAVVDGQTASQLMLVVGTSESGLHHPNWQENLSLAIKLHTTLEKQWPGICRPISFRSQRFNQDLSPGAMLIEVGAAGDTHQQALTAATALAQAILMLSGA